MVSPPWETGWQFFKKLKVELLPRDLASLGLGVCTRELSLGEIHGVLLFGAVLFTVVKREKQTQVSSKRLRWKILCVFYRNKKQNKARSTHPPLKVLLPSLDYLCPQMVSVTLASPLSSGPIRPHGPLDTVTWIF